MHFTTLSNVSVRSCNAVLLSIYRFYLYIYLYICTSLYVQCIHIDSQCSATSHKCAYQWMCQKRCRELIIHFAFLEEAAAEATRGICKMLWIRRGGKEVKSTPTNSDFHSRHALSACQITGGYEGIKELPGLLCDWLHPDYDTDTIYLVLKFDIPSCHWLNSVGYEMQLHFF